MPYQEICPLLQSISLCVLLYGNSPFLISVKQMDKRKESFTPLGVWDTGDLEGSNRAGGSGE
jgi:hypothetical protein